MSASRIPNDDADAPLRAPVPFAAAKDNYSGEWNDIIAKLGFVAVILQMARCQPVFERGDFCESLGEEMQREGLGHFDSSQFEPHIRHFFYTNALEQERAFEFLKSGLERRGLLDYAAIWHFDATDKIWRNCHPGGLKS